MFYYVLGTSLGYVGTDEVYLIKEEKEFSDEEMGRWASSQWWEDFNSSGAVFDPALCDAVDRGDMTEEEAEEERDNALHGMVVYEEDCWMTRITKENLEEMLEELQRSHDYSEEKEAEIRASLK